MENIRTAVQKVAKLKELGVFDKWVANADKRMGGVIKEDTPKDIIKSLTNRRNDLLTNYSYLSDMIESSFIFYKTSEGFKFWDDIVDELRNEI